MTDMDPFVLLLLIGALLAIVGYTAYALRLTYKDTRKNTQQKDRLLEELQNDDSAIRMEAVGRVEYLAVHMHTQTRQEPIALIPLLCDTVFHMAKSDPNVGVRAGARRCLKMVRDDFEDWYRGCDRGEICNSLDRLDRCVKECEDDDKMDLTRSWEIALRSILVDASKPDVKLTVHTGKALSQRLGNNGYRPDFLAQRGRQADDPMWAMDRDHYYEVDVGGGRKTWIQRLSEDQYIFYGVKKVPVPIQQLQDYADERDEYYDA